MPWKEISTFTSSSATQCIYFILSLFVTSFFTSTKYHSFIHPHHWRANPSNQLHLVTSPSNPSSPCHQSRSDGVSRHTIVRLSLRTNFPGFSLLQECQSPTFHDAIGNFVYASSHLFLTLELAIFHSSPSTFSTRWHHHYFPQDSALHQSYYQ